jgi:hypothetical protein
MKFDRTAPTAWVVTGVAAGILLGLGGIATTSSATSQFVMATGAVAFGALGMYTAMAVHRRDALTEETDQLKAQIEEMRTVDASLRTRMAYTLRDPLTSIVGFADHLVNSPDLAFDEQRELLMAIRTNAREVERTLSELAETGEQITNQPSIEAVVLLDEELASIASTIVTNATFESDLSRSRAWGDSAKVRQILRTVLNAATDSGCAYIALRTAERSNRATATVSGRDDLLISEAIAALTGNTVAEDLGNDNYRALRSAYELAASLKGNIGYAQAFGISHIVIELPLAPSDLGITAPVLKPDQPFELSFAAAADLRPERPTSAIRFA